MSKVNCYVSKMIMKQMGFVFLEVRKVPLDILGPAGALAQEAWGMENTVFRLRRHECHLLP